MRGNALYNVSDPVNPQDVVTKKYADRVGGGESAIIALVQTENISRRQLNRHYN